MKKLLSVVLGTFLACSCALAEGSFTYGTTTTLPLSEGGAAFRTQLAEAHENELLKEDYYPTLLSHLEARTEQKFPEVEVAHTLAEETYGENKVYTLSTENPDCIVLYYHGGAYALEISQEHVKTSDLLCERLNAKVYMPLYPLAPQATYKIGADRFEGLPDHERRCEHCIDPRRGQTDSLVFD